MQLPLIIFTRTRSASAARDVEGHSLPTKNRDARDAFAAGPRAEIDRSLHTPDPYPGSPAAGVFRGGNPSQLLGKHGQISSRTYP